MIGWLLSQAGGYIAAFAALVASLGAVWLSGRSSGKRKAQNDALKDRLDTAQKAKEIDDDVEKSSDDAVRSELRKWMRNGD